ncbi:hypothetical protein ES319_D06G032900v1 [Gossypium barbadense]|uniref:Uncharacterized protein n=2 Tax=Gossypium TaxID=3633 RepID=A0A5J5R0L6_GOSBA|nr:hypothetical protein ES319_D06G032900v1 [Gossypium barbadense]TYG63505.1 hypothetical protein ES288_D06G035500v1 [Gossypium darwinii]
MISALRLQCNEGENVGLYKKKLPSTNFRILEDASSIYVFHQWKLKGIKRHQDVNSNVDR